MYHRLSLGNFEPLRYNNMSKERIFDPQKRYITPKREITPKRDISQNIRKNQDNLNKQEVNIIKNYQNLPILSLENENQFFERNRELPRQFQQSTERDKRILPQLIGQCKNLPSSSPFNRIKTDYSRSPNIRKPLIPNDRNLNIDYKVSTCSIKPQISRQFNDLEIKIDALGKWSCIVTENPLNVCRISKQDEIYILKGFEDNKPFSQEQIDKQIKQHLLAKSLLKSYYKSFQGTGISLPQTQFDYSNILLFQKVSTDEFWIAERKYTSKLIKYNGPDGQIFKNNYTDNIDSEFLNSFSYYTYIYSDGKYMILNIKGHGSILTDPQIKLAAQRQIRTKFLQNYQGGIFQRNVDYLQFYNQQ